MDELEKMCVQDLGTDLADIDRKALMAEIDTDADNEVSQQELLDWWCSDKFLARVFRQKRREMFTDFMVLKLDRSVADQEEQLQKVRASFNAKGERYVDERQVDERAASFRRKKQEKLRSVSAKGLPKHLFLSMSNMKSEFIWMDAPNYSDMSPLVLAAAIGSPLFNHIARTRSLNRTFLRSAREMSLLFRLDGIDVPHGLRLDSEEWPVGKPAIWHLCKKERVELLSPELRSVLVLKWRFFGVPCFAKRCLMNLAFLSVFTLWSLTDHSVDSDSVLNRDTLLAFLVWVWLFTVLVRRGYYRRLFRLVKWVLRFIVVLLFRVITVGGYSVNVQSKADGNARNSAFWPAKLEDAIKREGFAKMDNTWSYLRRGMRSREACVGLQLDYCVFIAVLVLSAMSSIPWLIAAFETTFFTECPANPERFADMLKDTYRFQAVCVVWGWLGWGGLYMLLGISRKTGVLVMIVWRLLKADFLVFLNSFVVFLFAFVLGYSVLQQAHWTGLDTSTTCDNTTSTQTQSFSVMGVQHILYIGFIGEPMDGDDTISADWGLDAFIGAAISVLFMVTVPLLLLNLFIAMLNYSYNEIYETAQANYELERAALMYQLEGSMALADVQKHRRKYCADIGGEAWMMLNIPRAEIQEDLKRSAAPRDGHRVFKDQEQNEGSHDDVDDLYGQHCILQSFDPRNVRALGAQHENHIARMATVIQARFRGVKKRREMFRGGLSIGDLVSQMSTDSAASEQLRSSGSLRNLRSAAEATPKPGAPTLDAEALAWLEERKLGEAADALGKVGSTLEDLALLTAEDIADLELKTLTRRRLRGHLSAMPGGSCSAAPRTPLEGKQLEAAVAQQLRETTK